MNVSNTKRNMPKVNACYQADEGDAEDVGLESFILKSEKAEALDKEYDETYFILADMEKDAEFETRRIGRYPVEFTTIEREMTQEEVIETLQTVSSLEEFKEIYGEPNAKKGILAIIFYFVLHHTTFGRKIYATGSNAKCANLVGVNTTKVKIAVYAISGFMAVLAGLIMISRVDSAQPTLGDGYELDAIAAVALGGTSMSGGRGKIVGTLAGVLIIAVLNNGLNITVTEQL